MTPLPGQSGATQWVERNLAKVDFMGSIVVTRSNFFLQAAIASLLEKK